MSGKDRTMLVRWGFKDPDRTDPQYSEIHTWVCQRLLKNDLHDGLCEDLFDVPPGRRKVDWPTAPNFDNSLNTTYGKEDRFVGDRCKDYSFFIKSDEARIERPVYGGKSTLSFYDVVLPVYERFHESGGGVYRGESKETLTLEDFAGEEKVSEIVIEVKVGRVDVAAILRQMQVYQNAHPYFTNIKRTSYGEQIRVFRIPPVFAVFTAFELHKDDVDVLGRVEIKHRLLPVCCREYVEQRVKDAKHLTQGPAQLSLDFLGE